MASTQPNTPGIRSSLFHSIPKTGKDDEPLLRGTAIDFQHIQTFEEFMHDQSNDDSRDLIIWEEARLKALRNALRQVFPVDSGPFMVTELSTPWFYYGKEVGWRYDLECDFEDSTFIPPQPQDHVGDEFTYRNPPIHITPPMAMLVFSASDVFEMQEVEGKTMIRVNRAYPTYVWFQAINLYLHVVQKSHSRFVPIPVTAHVQQTGQDHTNIYAIQVDMDEYREYQDALVSLTQQYGPIKGFQMAAEFGLRILENRVGPNYQNLPDQCEKHIFPFQSMINRSMKGVLVLNALRKDLKDHEMKTKLNLYF